MYVISVIIPLCIRICLYFEENRKRFYKCPVTAAVNVASK